MAVKKKTSSLETGKKKTVSSVKKTATASKTTSKKVNTKTTQNVQKKSKTQSSTTVTLPNLDVEKILLLHYGKGNVDVDENDDGIQETILDYDEYNINDILHESGKQSKRSTIFLDPHKGQVKLWSIMIDFTLRGALPRFTNMACWTCRNKFTSHPIGCPIKYINSRKDCEDEKIKEWFKENNLLLDDKDGYFLTEGVFCMFPCVKSYIFNELSRTKSPKYKKALGLLSLMYFKLTGNISVIPHAGSWKITKDWGGHLTPQEYRASVGSLEYTETTNIRRPYMFCTSQYIQERRIKDE